MIIRRTQPRTMVPKPSYAFGSEAAQLAAKGLSPRQVDARHPAPPAIRGAGHAKRVRT